MNKVSLAKSIAVTAELCGGTVLSREMLKIFVEKLKRYDEQTVCAALSRCQDEVKGRLCPADVISRIDDGRPGVEEAWAMLPRSEGDTVVWTDEMAQAYGIVRLSNSDEIAMRMSFKEVYTKLLIMARQEGGRPKWTVSLGSVPGRQGPLFEAMRRGRITAHHVRTIAPELAPALDYPELPPCNTEPKLLEQINAIVKSTGVDGRISNNLKGLKKCR